MAKANNFLGNMHRLDKREQSSYPMYNSCCGEESGGCNNGDLLAHCSDELNFESGKPKVCEISREYYA